MNDYEQIELLNRKLSEMHEIYTKTVMVLRTENERLKQEIAVFRRENESLRAALDNRDERIKRLESDKACLEIAYRQLEQRTA